MLRRLFNCPAQLVWLGLGVSTSLWLGVATQTVLSSLTLSAPFLQLGPFFWIGLLLAVLAFFYGHASQRVAAICLLALYFNATLAFVCPYTVMHDSIVNTLLFPTSSGVQQPYSISYNGFSGLVFWVEGMGAIDPWQMARFFPVGMIVIYLLSIGMIVVSWRGIILSSARSSGLFAFFFFVLSGPFYLRINASPQTIGFAAFLVALGLLPLAARSIPMKLALLVAFATMIISHPLTPLLAIPGIATVAMSSNDFSKEQLKKAAGLISLFLISYATWTLYRANWILSNSIKVVLNATTEDKPLPIVNTTIIPQVENYILMNRVFLIALLAVLAIGYCLLWRTKTWYFVSAWGLAFAPAFVILLGYHDFFDRVMLFMLIPCAIVFAEAGERLCQSASRLKRPAAALIISLTLLSAAVSYFWLGAVDRVTQDEIDAVRYLAALGQPVKVYAGGFNLPISPNLAFIPSDRGIIRLDEVQRADAVVISSQLEHAVTLTGRSPLSYADLIAAIQPDYVEVFASDATRVFLKRSSARLDTSHGE